VDHERARRVRKARRHVERARRVLGEHDVAALGQPALAVGHAQAALAGEIGHLAEHRGVQGDAVPEPLQVRRDGQT
jgi:hypothetical protein